MRLCYVWIFDTEEVAIDNICCNGLFSGNEFVLLRITTVRVWREGCAYRFLNNWFDALRFLNILPLWVFRVYVFIKIFSSVAMGRFSSDMFISGSPNSNYTYTFFTDILLLYYFFFNVTVVFKPNCVWWRFKFWIEVLERAGVLITNLNKWNGFHVRISFLKFVWNCSGSIIGSHSCCKVLVPFFLFLPLLLLCMHALVCRQRYITTVSLCSMFIVNFSLCFECFDCSSQNNHYGSQHTAGGCVYWMKTAFFNGFIPHNSLFWLWCIWRV